MFTVRTEPESVVKSKECGADAQVNKPYEGVVIEEGSVIGPKKRVAPIHESHRILSTGRFLELGYDENNVYFVEK
jgi:hypothetical protein